MDRGKSTHKLTYRVDPADAERRISEIDTIDRATAKEMIYPSNAGCERDLMPFGVHIPHLPPYTMKTKEMTSNIMGWNGNKPIQPTTAVTALIAAHAYGTYRI